MKPRTMSLRLPEALFLTVFLFSGGAHALEIETFGGSMDYQRIDGCCQSTGPQTGVGMLVRMSASGSGVWDFTGYSDRRWSEFSVMRPTYLIGDPEGTDPDNDPGLQVRRMKVFKWIASSGIGFFTHSTRTVLYDLPAIASGFSIALQTQAVFVLNDRWSLSGSLRMAGAFAADDKGYVTGAFVGLVYRPK